MQQPRSSLVRRTIYIDLLPIDAFKRRDMADFYKIVRVFIASPGGLEAERKAVADALEEINRRNSSHWKIQFKPVGWEDTIGGNRRPQSLINRDLETCDYFVGILGDHWGSPPESETSTISRFTSGFHEEYELAQALYAKGSMHDIFLFFKSIPSERIRDAGPSLQSVLGFKEKVKADRQPFYYEFPDLEAFSRKVGDTLSTVGWRIAESDVDGRDAYMDAPAEKAAPPNAASNERSSIHSNEQFHITGGARQFLFDLLAKEGQDDEAMSPADVARLRLIGIAESQSGNDSVRIGVHDANILFRCRRKINLSNGERYALLVAGLRYFEHQNVPFWAWTEGNPATARQLIQSWMGFPDGDEQLSALRLATALGYEIPHSDIVGYRATVIRRWFVGNTTSQLVNLASMYLAKNGSAQDIDLLDELLPDAEGQNIWSIHATSIAIMLRTSIEAGVDALISRDPEFLNDSVLNELVKAFQQTPSSTIEKLTKLKSEGVRLAAVRELRRRAALGGEVAEELSADSSYDVRLESILALAEQGVQLPAEKVRASLTKPGGRRATGFASYFSRTIPDTSRHEIFELHRLKTKPLADLVAMDEATSDPFNADAFLAACEMYPRQMRPALRDTLGDGFRARFDLKVRLLENGGIDAKKDLSIDGDLREFSCNKQTRRGLDILAAQMDKNDLNLVRKAIDTFEVFASEQVVSYLGKFGSWGDIDRLVAMKSSDVSVSSLLGLYTNPDPLRWLVAKAIYKLGSSRLVDLIEKIDGDLKARVIRLSSKAVLKELSNDIVLKLMNDANDKIRKITCLRALEIFPKSRLERLLDRYVDQAAYRYYSTIHWLDLGTTMPNQLVMDVVRYDLNAFDEN